MDEAGFHFDIGDFRCTVFSDGTLVTEDSEGGEVYSLNCLLVESGNHKILIDTGCGDGFQATAGRLVNNLAAAGVGCSDIDRVILTHGHVDHAAGCFDSQGRPVFPRARFIASEREWKYWEVGPGQNALQNIFFDAARKNLLPIREKFDLAGGDVEVLPGIRLIAAPGHTPGLVMVELTSRQEQLLCIGDVVHSQREFVQPDCLALFDITPEQALDTRARILSDVAESGIFIFACHFPFPGLGYIKEKVGRFVWQSI
jgi:glyoxylase-like metal-dependent hydrolase (beta-lactamase superfamily II)